MAVDPCWICRFLGIGQDPPVNQCQPCWWKQIESSKSSSRPSRKERGLPSRRNATAIMHESVAPQFLTEECAQQANYQPQFPERAALISASVASDVIL